MSCLVAHDAAYYDTDILHHDISVGNIMISEEGEGFLIDWNMCVWVGPGAMSLERVERTVGSCICSKIDLLLISVSTGNMAIYVSSSPPEYPRYT